MPIEHTFVCEEIMYAMILACINSAAWYYIPARQEGNKQKGNNMGYRSDIRVMTDLEGFEKMQDIAWELKEERNLNDDVVLFPMHGQDPDNFFDYYDAQEDYLCFGIDWVKWYDNYQDVALFMDTLKVANDNGVKWQFIRIGEEWGDVEEDSSDNFYNNPVAVMGVRTEITY